MIVTNKVNINIVGRNVKYYNSKGYTCKVFDTIEVDVLDLPDSCRVIIDYTCDYCGELNSGPYSVYKKSEKTNGKKSCNSCKQIKIEETNLKKYNCKRPLQNSEIYSKLTETNINKYGTTVPAKNIDIANKISLINKNKYIDKIKELNIGEFIQINNFGSYDIKCNVCNNIFEFNPSKNGCTRIYTNKTPCYYCLPLNKTNAENEIIKFIKTIYDGEIITNTRSVINPYELDIYLPELNIAFEYNGLYWHSDIYKNNHYHLNKTKLCEDKNIKLIHIFEDEWINKQNIIKNIILKTISPKKLNVIYARKCIIKEVNNKIAKEFFNKYHIQGHRNSNIYVGLYHNEILVACMSINNKLGIFIKTDKNIPEVVRFCTNNTIVTGGLSKLLKYYFNTYNQTEIISYIDRCKFNGSGYIKSGFEIISKSKPGYYYSKNNLCERIHRFKFNKTILIKNGHDKNKSESQIMSELGYYKIYDCGQIKLKYTYK